MHGYRVYDHRVKQMIIKSNNPFLFPNLNIPYSTAITWIKKGIRDVVTFDELEQGKEDLLKENIRLKHELAKEGVKNELIIFTFRIFGLQIQYRRLPYAQTKEDLLSMIKKAALVLPLKDCLDVIGLTSARYYSWIKRQVKCLLIDQTSCPRLCPNKLTSSEVSAIKELITTKDYSHFSIPSLAWFARRQGKVFASISSWYRIISDYNLKRPLHRIYPPKPKIGIRTSQPNQIWHLDQTIFRLENGPKIFIQSIIDNASRFILASKATLDYGGIRTRTLLEQGVMVAKQYYPTMIPTVYVDSGSENLNLEVDQLVDSRIIDRMVAQIDIHFSNSMIERFFMSLKHRWLYLISLSSFEQVVKALDQYIHDYCHVIPQDVLNGGTPFEVFSGKWTDTSVTVIGQAAFEARRKRVDLNKSYACGACPT